jgi:hypothetical protein
MTVAMAFACQCIENNVVLLKLIEVQLFIEPLAFVIR